MNAASSGRRVWLVNLYFGAGVAPTGLLLESLAWALTRNGFEVEVLAGRTDYNAAVDKADNREAGKVHRVFSGPRQAKGVKGRFLAWASFYLRAALFAFTHRWPDTVIVLTTPPFLHAVFVLRNVLSWRKARVILWNQDTYPEVLGSVGVLSPRSLPYRLLAAVQRWATSRLDLAVSLDQGMADLLTQQGVRRVVVIPNWDVDPPGIKATAHPELAEVIHKAKADYQYLVVYTGNYGWGHDLSALFEYLRRHPVQRGFFFLFVGGGEKWQQLEAFKRENAAGCMEVLSYVPRTSLMALLRAADFGLVALKQECVGLMSPSKIHGYLTRGKPLLYLGPRGSNVAEAIENYDCGLRVDETDAAALAHGLEDLLRPEFDYEAWSRNAFGAARQRYCEAAAHADFLRLLGVSSRSAEQRGSPNRVTMASET